MDVAGDVIDIALIESTVDGIGQSFPQAIAFEGHFHVNGLEWGRQVLADLLEIGFDAKIPQGSRFPMEKRHANGCLVLAFGWFHG
jgi:hypothetical protein